MTHVHVNMFLEEMGGMVDKKTLMEIYKMATKEQYNFLYVKLNAKKLNETSSKELNGT